MTALLDNKAYQMSGNVNTSVTDNWQLTGTYMYYKSEEPANPFYTSVLGSQPVFDTGSAILNRDVNLVSINSTHITGDASVLTFVSGTTASTTACRIRSSLHRSKLLRSVGTLPR